jgi:hypothetical protein
MKLSIIPADNTVCKDGYCISDLDLSFMAPNIHAVQWDTNSGWIECVALPDGSIPAHVELTSIEEYTSLIAAFDAAKSSAEQAEAPVSDAELVRGVRDGLMMQSDWSQAPDSTADREAWATYRQALRDITTQEGFPTNITWPTKP